MHALVPRRLVVTAIRRFLIGCVFSGDAAGGEGLPSATGYAVAGASHALHDAVSFPGARFFVCLWGTLMFGMPCSG